MTVFLETKNVTKSRIHCTYVINEWSLWDHPYITSAKKTGWVQKMASCVDVQYRTNFDIVGGSEIVQIYADVIYGWSLT